MNSAPKGGKQEYLARKKKRIDKMFLGGIGNVEKVLDRPLKVTRRIQVFDEYDIPLEKVQHSSVW